MKNINADFPKYTSFEGWYATEQKRWELTDEQKAIIRNRRLARLAGQLVDTPTLTPQETTSAPDKPNPVALPENVPEKTVNTDSQNHESKLVHFAAETFEEAQQLSNPLPDTVIDQVILSKGEISMYSFVEPDESDLAITKQMSEDYYYNGVKTLRADFARTIDGRSTYVPHFVFSQFDTPEFAKRRAAGEKIQVTDRIYLNPKQLDRIEIYKEFLERAEEEELALRSKIYESISSEKGGIGGLRQDAIVIYATPENKNQTLALVQDIYQNHKESFQGRTSAPQTCEIAPGLALGSEPVKYTGSESLSSIRKKILDASYKNVVKAFNKKGITPSKEQLSKNIRRYAEAYMKRNNISTHNWSFDLNQ
jgi:hypothetical protein